jgi:hypothetical protein
MRLDAQGILTRYWYFVACLYNRRLEEFEPVLEQWQKEASEHSWPQLVAAWVAAERGEELTISESARDVAWKDVAVAGHLLPAAYSSLGKTEEALTWLERGVELGFINYPFLSQIDPRFENLRRDPRSKELFERIKKEWEEFEV